MIKINGDESYLGKVIREWCEQNKQDPYASEVYRKYYADDVEYKPADNVFYFVEYTSTLQSYRDCGSSKKAGCMLSRDLDKSPRKAVQKEDSKKIALDKLESLREEVKDSQVSNSYVASEKFDTHYVIKKLDAEKYLNAFDQMTLAALLQDITAGRVNDGKTPVNQYLVCNVDEPYADKIRQTILEGESAKGNIEGVSENDEGVNYFYVRLKGIEGFEYSYSTTKGLSNVLVDLVENGAESLALAWVKHSKKGEKFENSVVRIWNIGKKCFQDDPTECAYRMEVDTGSGGYGFTVTYEQLMEDLIQEFSEAVRDEVELWAHKSEEGSEYTGHNIYLANIGKQARTLYC